jgi:hypothetical protein
MRLGPVARAIAFWGPTVAAAAAVAAVPPHTVDGPAHLLGGTVLAHWHTAPVYRQFYSLGWFPTPNLAAGLLLAGLIRLVGVGHAETVLLVACVVALPLALRWAITAIRPAAGWTGVAALPFAFNYLYGYGFYNFCLGLALCLCCAGAALRAAPHWAAGPSARLGALVVVTWFTHLVAFAVAIVFLAAVVACVRRPWGARPWLGPAVAVLPGLALTGAYLAHTSGGAAPRWSDPFPAAVGLVSLHTQLVTYRPAENVVAGALAVALSAIALATPRVGRGDARIRAVALAGAGTAALGLLAPESFGIAFGLIGERLSLFPVLFGLLWCFGRPIPRRWAAAGVAACLAATAALGAVRLPELRREDRSAAEYLSAARYLRPGSTLIALRFAEFGPRAGRNRHFDPLRHLSSALAARTDSVDVGHYEAVLEYFPGRFRPDRDLRAAVDPGLGGLEQVPPRVDLPAAGRVGRIDYVLLIGAPQATGTAAAALAATRAGLARDYTMVGRTVPSGLVEVWAGTGGRAPGA